MKKRKMIAVFMLVLVAAILQGCISARAHIQDKNPVYSSAEEEIVFLVDAIEREDAQAIKDKFSAYAISNIDNLDEKIDRLIEEFPGWNDDYELSDTFERWSNHGDITYMLTPSYDFVVDGRTYCLRMIYYKESDEDESKLGYYSIQIMELHTNSYSDDVYMHGTTDEPDILLWDYTKD